MKIGVISDTHGFLDPAILRLFQEVEHILHAGDIGPASLIVELERLAPVTAVTGNTDSFLPYRDTEMLELGGFRFLIHHIVDLDTKHSEILQRVETQKPDAVIFGHTHKPFATRRNGIFYFNPGYAGKQRFDLQRTAAILNLSPKGIKHAWTKL